MHPSPRTHGTWRRPSPYQASAGDVTTMFKADVVYNGIHLEGKMGSIFDNLTKTK